jgi:3-phenylpropionate/cinnamic acid dioxygenase small subunit
VKRRARRGTSLDIQGVQDKLEIQELLARYARGVDDRDWDLYRSVFTEDAHIDYTSAGAIAGARDEVAAFLAKVFVTIPWSQHFITNIEIELDGDAAHVRALFYNPLQLPGMNEPSFCGGSYHHDVVRTADGWKSRRLLEENRWFVNPPT